VSKVTVVIHPKPTGSWPKGEPQSIRDTYDQQQGTNGTGGKGGRAS